MKKNIVTFLVITLVLSACCNNKKQAEFLHVAGQEIHKGGENFILRGMGLGGWMLQEGYMLRIPSQGSQSVIKARITDLIGEEECERFYDLWLKNHLTRTDIDSMANWGFNSVRLPMHYNLFTLPVEQEPDSNQNTWFEKGFALTDSLLAWCKANDMYLILDLHAAPGGQGKDANISDYNPEKPSLWESDLNKKKTVALWRKLAEYYADEPFIGGYDIINEPNWTFEGKNKNGIEDECNQPIWDLYKEITKAIREVDKKHIIFIEGNGWANNYRGFPGPWDDNMVISFHKYWNPNTQEAIAGYIDMREKYNVPLWLGETGENTNEWFRDCVQLIEANNIGWAWWPLKKVSSPRNPLTIVAPEGYEEILAYWETGENKPTEKFSKKVLFQLAENLKAENCIYNEELINALFSLD